MMNRFRNSVLLVITCALVCGAASMASAQSQLPVNGSVSGSLSSGSSTYSITIPADGSIVFTAQPSAQLSVYLNLYDTDGSTLIGGSSPASPGVAVTATLAHPGPGTYYVSVVYYYGHGDSYTLSDTYTQPTVTNDVEPNDTPQTGTTIKAGKSATGHLGYSLGPYTNQDSVDYYKVSIPSDGDLTYTVTPDATLRLYIVAYDTDGTSIVNLTNPTVPGAVQTLTIPHLGHGVYYFAIYFAGGADGCGGYTLRTTWKQQSVHNDREPDDTYQTANSINMPAATTGHLGYSRTTYNDVDPVDYYQITLPAAGRLTVDVSPTSKLSVYIWIYDASGVHAIGITGQGKPGQPVSLTLSNLPVGTYYAAIHLYSSYGGYRLSAHQ